MFERFTNRARRVVVLAQEEARMLNHNYVGTEHLLLGLIHEGQGTAAKALESLGIGLDMVRREVEEVIGEGQEAPSGHIPFTPRAKKVLELSLREALELNHNYIGTEHILLGLIREGEGVAAQVLVRLGADLDRVRQQVIDLLAAYKARAEEAEQAVPSEPAEPSAPSASAAPAEGRRRERQAVALAGRIEAIEARLSAIELRLGSGPDLGDLDEQITQVTMEKQEAVAAGRHEQAAALRNRERRLLDRPGASARTTGRGTTRAWPRWPRRSSGCASRSGTCAAGKPRRHRRRRSTTSTSAPQAPPGDTSPGGRPAPERAVRPRRTSRPGGPSARGRPARKTPRRGGPSGAGGRPARGRRGLASGRGHQPRSRHSGTCGRSVPSVVSLPCPG